MDHIPGRGRGRGLRVRSSPVAGETPVSGHTRAHGFNNFISINGERARLRRQVQARDQVDNSAEQGSEDGYRGEEDVENSGETISTMSLLETNTLKQENAKHRDEVQYYHNRRVMIFLERSDQNGDIVKQDLSKAGLDSLRKTLKIMQEYHEKADENFRLLRRSLWFTEEDIQAHEEWYGNVATGLISILDQVSELEKTNNVAAGSALGLQSFMTPPIASSERYASPIVEPLKLDQFNGQTGTFRAFKTRFNLVMKKGKIDEGLQAEHLLRCLFGEPLRIAMMVDLEDPEALSQMWYRLNERFGNEQCDYQHHVTELQKLATYPVCKTDADLKELYYTFTEHIFAVRRISKNQDAGDDYKTTLCALLPDYIKRKMYKIMHDNPQEYTLNKMMQIVSKQVGLSNMETVSSGRDLQRHPSNSYGREQGNLWAKSRIEAEKRAQACAGRLSGVQYADPSEVGSVYSHSGVGPQIGNKVTVGQETFDVPGPVARACYRVNRTSSSNTPSNHYSFSSCTVPPITQYISSLTEQTNYPGASTDQPSVDKAEFMQGWGNLVAKKASNPHMYQVNAGKSGAAGCSTGGGSSAWGNKTVNLNLINTAKSCVFCRANHGSLDCRVYELGNQYMDSLNNQGRCFNCFRQDHVLPFCPVDSTCKVSSCNVTIKHCHFFCGNFKQQVKSAYGVVSCSVDAMGNFDNARLHTVLFLLMNPETGVEHLVRGFLDGGCTDTFLLEEVARKLSLTSLNGNINFLLSTFGPELVPGEGSLVKAVIKSIDGSYVSPVITCITKPTLMQDVDSFKLSDQQQANIQQGGYKLSDDGASINGRLPVDVVIGQDIYYQLIRGAPVHCAGGLVLVDTVFGYTLGGPVESELSVEGPRAHYMKCQLPEGIHKFIDLDGFPSISKLSSALPMGCIPQSEAAFCKNETLSITCLFCGGQHGPLDCTLFTDMQQFVDILKVQGRCFNCLSPGHIIYFCPNPSSCHQSHCKRRGKHSPLVCNSGLASSPSLPSDHGPVHSCSVNTFKMSADEVQTTLKRLADLETLGITTDDKEESPVLDRFKSEVCKDEQKKRVVIKLPWKHNRKGQLRANFPGTFERTNNLYEKLSKPSKREIFEEYDKVMEEQVKLGILEEVADIGTVTDVREKLKEDPYYYDHFMPCHQDSKICYLPHHAVVKASTQKLRVVYDASAKPFKGAHSLNECLEVGPPLYQVLADVLTRFRLGKCAYVADIAKAFLQIVVDPCDRDSLRLLWRNGDRVIIYRFNRLPFGLTSSPFLLAATLRYLLETSDLDPEEVRAIIREFYVDDLVSSKDSEEEVINERDKVKEMLGEGSMNLRKWNSNSVVLKGVFGEDEEEPLPEEELVLGMVWDTHRDVISINNSRIVKSLSNRNTKEEVYSVIAQVFDPMGLLSPYVFLAKRMLQKACLAKIDWKDKLPPDLKKEWEAWKADLPHINEVKYDRWVAFEGATEFELHGFCDASGEGLAANIYIVSKGNGKVQSRLLRCRTRVHSSKTMSMPRRELCATVLLSLVMHIVAEALAETHLNIIKRVYYTDSMNALYWITSDHYNWPVFVANRIKQVRDLTNTDNWRYVNTAQNPADLPSRGCMIDVLKDHMLFREGPRFLVTAELPCLGKMDTSSMPDGCRTEYPRVALAAVAGRMEPTLNLNKVIPDSMINLHGRNKFGYWKLIKLTKLVYRAVALMRAKRVPVDPEQWSTEKVELDWVRTIQSEEFGNEIAYCKSDKTSQGSKPCLVKALSLFWDGDAKVLRCSTRLQEANIQYNSANPMLIPRDCEFTHMLIMAVHQRVGHVGVKQTLSTLRAEFWVPKARRLVKKIVDRCVTCRRVSASPFDLPPPPPLPKSRVTMSRPFSNLGVDFCGPFHLRRKNKWYVAIFTCAVTRAVHFEALPDLSAESFLQAFKRFIGRRGVPELVISDNAKTFKCVARKLRHVFDNPALQQYFNERRVRWHFYVERAPWHGGFVETCVKLFKGVFKKLIGRASLRPEEFRTMVVEAEQVVNSRPLTYLYEDQKEGEPLTPSKLLHGYNLTDLPPIGRGGVPERFAITTRSRVLERLQNRFWSEWSEGYLNELAERHFSQKVGKENIREPKEGEVVLLRGEHLPRNRWKLGVIEKVHRSFKGNRIRSVIVKVPKGKGYKGGEYRRSPKHVVPLEAELDD